MKNFAKIELKVKIIHTFPRSIYLVHDMGHAREISLICQKSNFFKVHDRFSHNKLIRTTIIRFIKISNYYCIVDLNQQRGGLKFTFIEFKKKTENRDFSLKEQSIRL